jgi:phosphate acetyltransferase
MTFLEAVRARAAAAPRRIVFPETADERTRDAVRELARLRVVEPIAVLDPSAPQTHTAVESLGVETRNPLSDAFGDALSNELYVLRQTKGITTERARQLAQTPLYFADGMVRAGLADGCVAGAVNTTADVLRAALMLVGAAEGVTTISSAFYMVVPPFRDTGESEVLTFTDCAVVRYPTAMELADIAIAAATDRVRIVGDEPRVAFLSFSTRDSAAGPSVDAIRAAVAEVRARAPELAVDGELQGDAALASEVARRKAPDSHVAGRANVLVFPSLDAGNIAYKLVQRLAGASAVGPIIQGLRRPCSDLSRGAVVDDIINVAAITALQADTRA